MAGWQSTQESLQGAGQAIAAFLEKKRAEEKQKQDFAQALQLYMFQKQYEQGLGIDKARQEAQIKAQFDPMAQYKQNFNRLAGIGFGGANPTAQDVMPLVPPQFQQRFAQNPTSPPGVVNQFKAQVRKPYEAAGQTLLPGPSGWAMVKSGQRGPAGTTTDEEIQLASKGIKSGNVPPDISKTTSFRDRTRISAALEKSGFNLSQANSEWNATQRFLSSMNSEKQVRLRQAISSVKDALDGLEQLNSVLSRSELAPLNKAQLMIQANTGNPLAVQYLGQINIIRDELAQVFMGGNSPTDKALNLAQETINKNWSPQQLQSAINNVRINLGYRENAINYASAQGTNPNGGGGTRYLPIKQSPAEVSQGKIGKYNYR